MMKLDGLCRPGFVQSAFVYKMDCLDPHESVLFFLCHRLKAVYLPLPFPITHCLYIPLLSRRCSLCLQAVQSCIGPVSQSALPSRDDALRLLYHICLVDCHCFLFTGWSGQLNPPPSLHHLHSTPFFFLPCVSC